MKKGNSLTIAYFIFLIIAVIASLFSWNGLSSIACGATIAGGLFSFADLTNRYASYYKKFIGPYKEDTKVQRERALLFKESLIAQVKNANEAIEMMRPYCEDITIKRVFSVTEEYIEKTNAAISEVDSIANDTFIADNITGIENDVKKLERCEITLLITGYILFFCIAVFDCLEHFFEPFLSVLTVLAFALIILNYLLQDVLERKAEESIAIIRARTKDNMQKIERMRLGESMPSFSIVDKAKELVAAYIKLKEEENTVGN